MLYLKKLINPAQKIDDDAITPDNTYIPLRRDIGQAKSVHGENTPPLGHSPTLKDTIHYLPIITYHVYLHIME